MSFAPRILMIAETDAWVGPLAQGLDGLGWPTITARSLDAALAVLSDYVLDAAVIDAEHPDYPRLAQSLSDAARPRRLPIMAVGPLADSATAGVDMALSQPPHPAQAALRFEQLVRAAVTEEEFGLRQGTFARHGTPMPADVTGLGPLRVLVAGAADHRFLALSNALMQAGAEVVAAPTPYTAFDYLHESAFDAAILWGAPDHAPALSIASGMKRNTRLYHIPLVLYLRTPGEIDLAELYHRGFADVAASNTPEPETAQRVLALATTHRRHLSIRKALEAARGSGLMDPATGLFTRDLFAEHLRTVADSARRRRRPLSVCVLRVSETESVALAREGGWLDRAMPQIGAMVSRLVRVEDTAARLSHEVFALALPATSGPAARLAAERIAAVIGCTAFDAGPDRSPFVIEFDIGSAEVDPGESIATVLERASQNLADRRKIVA